MKDKTSPNTIVQLVLDDIGQTIGYYRMSKHKNEYQCAVTYKVHVEPKFLKRKLKIKRRLRGYFDTIGIEHD